jgi:uncharacterized membrane protein
MSFLRQTIKNLSASPQSLFWLFALTHLVLWTLIPSLSNQNLPLDVIEGYAWGKEWLIGTHKHPPMQAWILESIFHLTGRVKWAPYLTSQIAIVTAFWAVWRTGRRIAGEKVGLIGVLLLEGVVYYNFTSPEFNPNVLQLPFWALTGWSFYKAVKNDKIIDWFLCGVWAAASMYTKYSSGVFLLVLVAALLAHRDGRSRLKSIGPYLSVMTASLLFLPHLLWLIHNDFLPWAYTMGRLERNSAPYSSLVTTILMVAGQIIALLFAIFLLIVIYDRRHAPERPPAASFDRIFLTFAAFGPFLAMFFLSLFLGYHIRDMWQTPFWNFTGLWAVVFMRPALLPNDVRRFAIAWTFVFIAGLTGYLANETLAPYVTDKCKRTIFPGKNLTQIVTNEWQERFHTPLRYVIGDMWPTGNVAWYTDDRPHVFLDGNPRISPWIDQNDLKKSGGIILWCIHCGSRPEQRIESENMRTLMSHAEIQEPLTLKRMTFAKSPPAVIGWAILPPEKMH